MKRIILICLFLSVLLSPFYGQDKNQFALGAQGSQMAGNMGFGINIVSPRFLDDLTVVASGNYIWTDQISDNDRWNRYWNARLGLAYNILYFNTNSRFYLEGGMILIIPNRKVTSDIGIGGYASLGVEGKVHSRIGLFLEAGCAAYEQNLHDLIITVTDRYPFSDYSLIISAGIRFYIR